MLTIIPPKSTGNTYIGATSGYKPAKVITINGMESTHCNRVSENPSVAITSNSDVSSWNTNADIVMVQEPVSNMDREIAELRRLIEEVKKGIQERELIWQKINKELNYADARLAKNNKSSYRVSGGKGDCYTWEI